MIITYLFNSSIPSRNPGSLQVIKTCEGFVNLRHKVNLVVPNTGFNTPVKKYYNLIKSPRILRLKFFKKFPQGLNYYLFSIFSIIYGLFLKTDLFITRNLFNIFILNILRRDVIIEIHHDISNEGRIVNALYKYFPILNKKNVIKIIAITASVKSYLVKNFNVDPRKIEIIPSASAINLSFKKIKKNNKYNVGYFGSLEKSKGIEFIMKLSSLNQNNNYYVFGGDKNQVDNLNKKKKNLNLKICPYIPYRLVGKYMKKMDVLLMPSNKNLLKSTGGVGNIAKYTSPLKLFDYLASGKLIIASNLKVFQEIIRNNRDCIMMNNLNPNTWCKLIKNLNKNLTKINKIKLNAYNLSKHYTYDIRAKKILKNIIN